MTCRLLECIQIIGIFDLDKNDSFTNAHHFIPTNCTNVLQPTNVIIQLSFKHAFRQEFNRHAMDSITKKLDIDNEVEMNFGMSIIKPQICNRLYIVWLHIITNPDMVVKEPLKNTTKEAYILPVIINDY